jgi:hypothetical protein
MIISNLNHFEEVVMIDQVEGGSYYSPYTFYESDYVSVEFNTENNFETNIDVDVNIDSYTASYGAKSQVSGFASSHYIFGTKADGLGVVSGTGAFSAATGYATAQSKY